MSKALIAVLATFGVGIVMLIVVVTTVIGAQNSLVTMEEGVSAQYADNQNNYDNMFKKFQEAAQVPAMYTEDLQKVYSSAIKSRYGEEGSKALFQFIKEQNPNFDAGLYKNLQAMIEAGRNSFQSAQTTLLDKCRIYKTELRVWPNSFLASFLGFPKVDLEKVCTVVTSDRTQNAFDTKKDEAIKLR
jgi:hypothetical protein